MKQHILTRTANCTFSQNVGETVTIPPPSDENAVGAGRSCSSAEGGRGPTRSGAGGVSPV